jgi:hypothetical protein
MELNENKPTEAESTIDSGMKKAPDLKDLKQDLTDATASYSAQCKKIEKWLDLLHMNNAAKVII